MVEIREDFPLPVIPRRGEFRERGHNVAGEAGFPRSVLLLGLLARTTVEKAEEVCTAPRLGKFLVQVDSNNCSRSLRSASRFKRTNRSCMSPRRCAVGSDWRRCFRTCSTAALAILSTTDKKRSLRGGAPLNPGVSPLLVCKAGRTSKTCITSQSHYNRHSA